MNPPSNAMAESQLEGQRVAAVAASPTRPLYWSVRRELWEYRSLYIAPLIAAAVSLFGFFIAALGRALATPYLTQRRAVLEGSFHFVEALIMGTAFIVGIIYCLDALHGERRDRSILFWKSLPVSDTTIVLSKAAIPLLVLPALAMAILVVTQVIMSVIGSAVLSASGGSVSGLWSQMWMFQMSLLYHMVTVHVLWYAPLYGWLLLVSGWARRAAFLWAALPPLAIALLERIAFNTEHFVNLLKYRITGPEAFDLEEAGRVPMHAMVHLSLGKFLSTPGLWIGLIVAAIFFFAAVRLRRYQGPI